MNGGVIGILLYAAPTSWQNDLIKKFERTLT